MKEGGWRRGKVVIGKGKMTWMEENTPCDVSPVPALLVNGYIEGSGWWRGGGGRGRRWRSLSR